MMLVAVLLVLLPALARASPTVSQPARLVLRQSMDQPVAVTDYSSYIDPAKWSQAAYCNPQAGQEVNSASVVANWGDGADVPYTYVAYQSSANRIVVSHQGTDPTKAESIANDGQFLFADLDSRLAGCLDGDTNLHSGFQDTWTKTADGVLSTVQSQLSQHPGASVLVTGHSLGAA